MKNVKVTALVPMKGNSERVPNKNIRELHGKPVCHWILESLSRSKYVDEELSIQILQESKRLFRGLILSKLLTGLILY